MLERDFNTGYVYIQDPLFTGNKRRVYEICDEIMRRGLKIRWGCDARVDDMKPELVQAMDAANCYELSLGVESAVQRHLDAVEKRTSPEKVRRAVQTIRENSDILVEGLFILGFPGETWDEAMQTIHFATSLKLDMAQFSIMNPYPGSPLFEQLAADGVLDTGVREDGTVDTAIWKRYSSYIMFTDIDPIWVTPSLTVEQLRKLQKIALRSFYLRPRQIYRALKRLRKENFVESVRIAISGFF